MQHGPKSGKIFYSTTKPRCFTTQHTSFRMWQQHAGPRTTTMENLETHSSCKLGLVDRPLGSCTTRTKIRGSCGKGTAGPRTSPWSHGSSVSLPPVAIVIESTPLEPFTAIISLSWVHSEKRRHLARKEPKPSSRHSKQHSAVSPGPQQIRWKNGFASSEHNVASMACCSTLHFQAIQGRERGEH